jgi:uncharacterized protein
MRMAYVLKFHFDPDFERHRLRPKGRDDGSVDQFDLGYAQNVVSGQTLAEWDELEPGAAEPDDAIVSELLTFPCGAGCRQDPSNPKRLLAAVNGHVSYADGLITVRETLVLGHDVDFHTGNIVAIGDVRIGGGIRSGFEVMGRNVTVRGTVEGCRLRAMGNIVCESGIQGGNRGSVRAGKSLRAKFCENASLHAKQNILVDGSAMHCRLYVGEKLAVKGRLTGGEVYCGEAVYAGERLGGGGQSQTRLLLGYDPELIRKDLQLKALVREDILEIEACREDMRRGDCRVEECGPRLEEHRSRLAIHKAQLFRLWSSPVAMRQFSACRVIVPGVVGANVEIGIGEAAITAPEDARDVVFRYVAGEIVMESPALRK